MQLVVFLFLCTRIKNICVPLLAVDMLMVLVILSLISYNFPCFPSFPLGSTLSGVLRIYSGFFPLSTVTYWSTTLTNEYSPLGAWKVEHSKKDRRARLSYPQHLSSHDAVNNNTRLRTVCRHRPRSTGLPQAQRQRSNTQLQRRPVQLLQHPGEQGLIEQANVQFASL